MQHEDKVVVGRWDEIRKSGRKERERRGKNWGKAGGDDDNAGKEAPSGDGRPLSGDSPSPKCFSYLLHLLI